jgi:hypothetical protein
MVMNVLVSFSRILIFAFTLIRFRAGSSTNTAPEHFIPRSVYEELEGSVKPDVTLFEKAYLGFIDLKLSGYISPDKNILSIVDFRLPSNKKRLWVIDLESRSILFHTYVAHGENSGDDKYALNFSNNINSHKSSLGFYLTQETYEGKNGLSLKLKGLEYGFNHNARKRYIVLHGADYATEKYINENGKLGHSEGCPAVPMGIHKSIIEVTKGGSCLLIYFPDIYYTENSRYFLEGF